MSRMKPMIGRMALLIALVSAPAAFGQELPPISAPRGFDEGTEYRIGNAQVQELLPWAYQTERELKKLKSSALAVANAREQRDFLVAGLKAIVVHSDQKRTELLLRYVLNRAIKVNEVIEQESDTRVPGVIDQQIRLALRSIDLALEYFQSDIDFLKEVEAGKAADLTHLPFAAFGKEYAALLMSLNASILDSSAQYRVGLMGLGLLAWDLFRDQDQKRYAPAILELKRLLDLMPDAPAATDRENVSRVRQIRKAYREFLALDGGPVAAPPAPRPADPAPEKPVEDPRPSPDRPDPARAEMALEMVRQVKKNAGSVDAIIAAMERAMPKLVTFQQFVELVQPALDNPSDNYLDRLADFTVAKLPQAARLGLTLQGVKQIKSTSRRIKPNIAAMRAAIAVVRSPSEYWEAVSPGISDPNEAYRNEITTVIEQTVRRLIAVGGGFDDIDRIKRERNSISCSIAAMEAGLPLVKSRADFERLVSPGIADPNSSYRQAIADFIAKHQDRF